MSNVVLGVHTVHWGQNSWDALKIHLRKLCGNCREQTAGERNQGCERGREADGHLHSEHTETDRKAGLEKCSNSLYKWHPERLVSQRTTLIPQLGLGGETPTYTVNGKVTFEKWGLHRDLIHWLTPGRGAFSPGRLCDLDWDYTLVWILSFSPLPRFYTDKESRVCALKQIPFHFHHGMK